MSQYLLNKLISLTLPPLFIVGSWLVFGSSPTQWTFLLMCVYTLGYTHLFIGGFYQVRSLARQKNRKRFYFAYILLVILSTSIIILALVYNLIWLVVTTTVPYFILHGFLNEKVLCAKTSNYTVPSFLFFSMALWMTGATFFSFHHPSFYSSYDLTFLSTTLIQYSLIPMQRSVILVGSWVGEFLMVFSSVLLLGHIIVSKVYRLAHSIVLIVFVVATLFILVNHQINYVYILFYLLMYHYITWAIYFGVIFKNTQPQRLPGYIKAHLWIIFITAGLYFFLIEIGVSNPNALVFNSYIFLLLTYIHINTAFMNDQWFRRILSA